MQSLENSEYVKARELCLKVLSYEPANTTMQQYMNALSETIKQSMQSKLYIHMYVLCTLNLLYQFTNYIRVRLR